MPEVCWTVLLTTEHGFLLVPGCYKEPGRCWIAIVLLGEGSWCCRWPGHGSATPGTCCPVAVSLLPTFRVFISIPASISSAVPCMPTPSRPWSVRMAYDSSVGTNNYMWSDCGESCKADWEGMLDQRFTRGCTFVDWNMLKFAGMVAHITFNAVDTSAASWVVKPMFGYW